MNGTTKLPQSHTEYEPTSRVCTVFFSALIGFALNGLLQQKDVEIAAYRWPCFILSLLLFLRILFGSANHIWYQTIRPKARNPACHLALFWDLSCLICFGLFAIFICGATEIKLFLQGMIEVGIFGTVIAVVNLIRSSVRSWSCKWLLINIIQCVTTILAYSCGWPIWLLVAIYFCLLCGDLHYQLIEVEARDNTCGVPKPAEKPTPASGDSGSA
jgi:hypothetical protein